MHTFQSRPFSNSIEAILVALCFVNFRNIVEASRVKKVIIFFIYNIITPSDIEAEIEYAFAYLGCPLGNWNIY